MQSRIQCEERGWAELRPQLYRANRCPMGKYSLGLLTAGRRSVQECGSNVVVLQKYITAYGCLTVFFPFLGAPTRLGDVRFAGFSG